jgi:GT2 family glycosyltransferase
MNLLIFLLLLLILFFVILNFTSILHIKKINDTGFMMEKYCDSSNKQSPLEIETYRHFIYRYIYQIDNNEYDNNKTLFENTYIIILILFSIIVLAFIKKILILNGSLIPIYILIVGFYIFFIYYGIKIKKLYKNIEDLKTNEKSELYKYAIIYKTLNAIMYINNFVLSN